MKTVYSCLYQDDALVLQSLLASAGIPSDVRHDGMLDLNPLSVTSVTGAQVMVADEWEADAMEVVRGYRAAKRSGRNGPEGT